MDITIVEISKSFLQGLNSIKSYLFLLLFSIVAIIGGVYVFELFAGHPFVLQSLLWAIAGSAVLLGLLYAVIELIRHHIFSQALSHLRHRFH